MDQQQVLILQARAFAHGAHSAARQVRKYTGRPYISHPQEVVHILTTVRSVPPTAEMVAAAWLHDVVEDTGVEWKHLEAMFPRRVIEMVSHLTDLPIHYGFNRAYRKQETIDRLKAADDETIDIKLADLIANTHDICERDPDFAVVYLKEKKQLLDSMPGRGDPKLRAVAEKLANQ